MNNIEYLDHVLEQYGSRVFSLRNAPSDAIYIGRGRGSIFGNPFPMNGEDTREQVCLSYRKWLYQEIKQNPEFAAQVKSLKDATVKCFCSNGTNSRTTGAKWCHGHILLSCANYLNE